MSRRPFAGMSLEKQLALGGTLLAVLLIVGTAIFSPAQNEDDPRPSTINAGPAGAKALWTLLPRLGYGVQRSEASLTTLNGLDAPHTTLLLANPWGNANDDEKNALVDFLQRGGRVLSTGQFGHYYLPGYYWQDGNDNHAPEKCETVPEGTTALAAAGPLRMPLFVLARVDLPEVDVAQACEGGAAVIDYRYGKGTAVWWASPQPLTNRGLHDDANLKLLLASIGPTDRSVLFLESDGSSQRVSPWSKTRGIPILAMVLQLLLAGFFLVLAFGRRHGPIRTLSVTPRTSPLEFAHSMGNLYHRAGAGEAATREARARLFHLFERGCGLSRETLHGSAAAIAADLQARLGYSNPSLPALLDDTAAEDRLAPARALPLVRALDGVHADLLRLLSRTSPSTATSSEKLLV